MGADGLSRIDYHLSFTEIARSMPSLDANPWPAYSRLMPGTSRPNLLRLSLGRTLLGLGILGLGIAVLLRFAYPKEAEYQGRTVSAWFRQACRAESFQPGMGSSAPGIEARIAFLEMGTHAVPFLVRESFAFRRDTLLRSNLHQLFARSEHRLPTRFHRS